jgi:hypothetical protein
VNLILRINYWGRSCGSTYKKKLEERNDRIIQAIIKKAENVCSGAIALK